MEFSEVKEKHFYLVNINTYGKSYNKLDEPIKCVAKCTQIQDFTDTHTGYVNVHFKCLSGYQFGLNDSYSVGERIATYGGRLYNTNCGIELLEEITNDKLKDTSIIFIDDTHYKKLVNEGVYKEYEL